MLRALRRPAEVAPPRMGALPKLPVFLDLDGKRAVVAGGTAAAAWKAELLAAAGAHVDIYAPDAGSEMVQLLARGAAAGTLTLRADPWRADALAGAVVAIADAADERDASAFYRAAREAGALVNVIDKPAFCQFQLGSIVNRAPVVVAISTDGGAPILAQAIRRRIETLLPAALSAWGRLAKSLRDAVNGRLATGAARRAFWESFAERALTEPLDARAEQRAEALIDDIAAAGSKNAGRGTLVGVGPGDAELLTLKAVRAMQSADVILFDDLVSDEVLELARREAKRMAVGKRGQRASCAQDDINALMCDLARQGKHVVRLKSGDPMIFGRAGEEIEALARHDIPVEVVPGVTSALAAAARLGVSLTHRDCARSVRFVTGHARDGELPTDLDWCGLADPTTTLVFYMGGRTAPLIAARLMASGLPPSTPAVVMTGVTRADERRWVGTLASLTTGPTLPITASPTLIGIGQAFAAARQREGKARPDDASGFTPNDRVALA
jgi:uroporphyrin-III C-methyltransferase / precorrin-2 dehydrogenase / sirohydrochlorin ferrochelatase